MFYTAFPQHTKGKGKEKFTPEEDQLLLKLIDELGDKDWKAISEKMPNRNRRQCRDRYKYYLSPDVNRQPWTEEDDELLLKLYAQHGNKWTIISTFFPNRTDIDVKNHYLKIQRKESKKYFIPSVICTPKESEDLSSDLSQFFLYQTFIDTPKAEENDLEIL